MATLRARTGQSRRWGLGASLLLLLMGASPLREGRVANNNVDAACWQFATTPPPRTGRSSDGVGVALEGSLTRRDWLRSTAAALFAASSFGTMVVVGRPDPALALVKGVAPPPTKKVGDQRAKCKNLDECQALAEQRERQQQQLQQEAEDVPTSQGLGEGTIQTTPGGVRYRDLVIPSGAAAAVTVVKSGDEVLLAYKVLKLGKRSYDGLSGEGTVVFSRGYGLEDDEAKPGDQLFRTVVGAYGNVVALNEALVGMKVGGTRRLGGGDPRESATEGPGGRGPAATSKTDYVVVPTAQLVAEEACFDQTKQPFPASYAQQRRMAQRFDQSLIMEVQVVSASASPDGL